MDDRSYARIAYDPKNPDNVTIEQIASIPGQSEELAEDIKRIIREEMQEAALNPEKGEKEEIIPIPEGEGQAETAPVSYGEELTEMVPNSEGEKKAGAVPNLEEEELAEATPNPEAGTAIEEAAAVPIVETEPVSESRSAKTDEHIAKVEQDIAAVYGTMRRLEKKFEAEILNAENRDHAVKSIYKELNEYKAGLVEKALKNVLYDLIDVREMMYARVRNLREKGKADNISLEEFESYADDIGDILERHDVTIYKGEAGVENVAVRQKIVRKTETEDESLVKKVVESLSYGYEYNGKVIYPEKINIYVKKK